MSAATVLFVFVVLFCFYISPSHAASSKSLSDEDAIAAIRQLASNKNRATSFKMALPITEGVQGYGVDLPSFAYDYSEYFVSATVTRQRYLTMVLIGHRIIYEDYPIEAISTEYENMEHWNQATKFWTKPKKYNVRAKLQQLYCVVHNHNDRNTAPYQVPATWLRVSSKALNETGFHSSFNRHIEILRCPLLHLSKQDQSHYNLDVDIFRKGAGIVGHDIAGHAIPSEKVHLISFSVPWEKSFVGYPDIPQFKAKFMLPTTAEKLQETISMENMDSSVATAKKSTVTIVACIPGIRLAHIRRSETGLAMLLEFVAHLFQQGVDQVILGVVLSSSSSHFAIAQTLFQTLYPQQTVLLISTAVPDFDDAAGFPGLQLSDNFADVFFLNHCLYLLKGKEFVNMHGRTVGSGPKFMLVMRANQILVSSPLAPQKTLKQLLSEQALHMFSSPTAAADRWESVNIDTRASVTGVFLGGANSASSSTGKDKDEKSSHIRQRSKDPNRGQSGAKKQKQEQTSPIAGETRRKLFAETKDVPLKKQHSSMKMKSRHGTQGSIGGAGSHSGKNSHSLQHQQQRRSAEAATLNRFCSIRLQQPSSPSSSPSSDGAVVDIPQYHFISDPMTVFHDNGPGQFTFMKDFFRESVPRTLRPSIKSSSVTMLFPWMVTLINIDKAVAIDVHTTEQLLQQYGSSDPNKGDPQQQPHQQQPSLSTAKATVNNQRQVHSDLSATHAIVYPICMQPTASSSTTTTTTPMVVEHGLINASFVHVLTYVPPAFTHEGLVDLPATTAASRLEFTVADIQAVINQEYQNMHAALQVSCQRLLPSSQFNLTTDVTTHPNSHNKAGHYNASHHITVDKEAIEIIRKACTDASALKLLSKHIRDEREKEIKEQRSVDLLTSFADQIDTTIVEKSRKDITPPFWQLCNTAHLSEILRKVFVSAT